MNDILEKLSNTVTDFCHYIDHLPPSALELSQTSRWGPFEVLCHLVFWHEQYCVILQSLVKGNPPELLPGSFKDLNALAVQKNKGKTRAVLLERLQLAQDKLVVLCHAPSAEKLSIEFKQGGKKRSLVEALTKVEAHFRSHQRQLQIAGFK